MKEYKRIRCIIGYGTDCYVSSTFSEEKWERKIKMLLEIHKEKLIENKKQKDL